MDVSVFQLCIGLGDPVESPSVLEALANGCVFLNPRRRSNEAQFKNKPTGRLVRVLSMEWSFLTWHSDICLVVYWWSNRY